jgi:hypothetical protein
LEKQIKEIDRIMSLELLLVKSIARFERLAAENSTSIEPPDTRRKFQSTATA